MAEEIDLQPVSHITTDAIGQPGKRVFYVQGWQGQRTITLIIEKISDPISGGWPGAVPGGNPAAQSRFVRS